MKTSLKIYNPCWGLDVARDWNLEAESVDLQTALAQPYRIACLPVYFNHLDNFVNKDFIKSQVKIDLSQFDLVILSDIEQERNSHILQWIQSNKIKNYVLALGASHNSEGYNKETTVLRSWWMYNLMRMNSFNDTPISVKNYWFDVLLGARRPHRDFVMLSLQKHSLLLDKCVVTYRDGFSGNIVDDQTTNIHNYFPQHQLEWPYISKNLRQDWEVKDVIEKSISPFVPWKIYEQTYYSVVCETGFTGDGFFLSEKTTKALYGKRLFVMFAPCQFLKTLRELGFETFGSIIDESYDEEFVDLTRYQMAFAQMLSLTQQDPIAVYDKVKDILEHNRQRLIELKNKNDKSMKTLLERRIPQQYLLV